MSTDAFQLLAAIDLRGGRVVRLVEGDFERETAYSDDPLATAAELVGQGSRWLHVVDLDGAREGRPAQTELITSLIRAVGDRASVEVGGGIRTLEAARTYLDAGAARIVVGTAALRSSLAKELVEQFGSDRVAVALDVRGGQAVGQGWRTGVEGIDLETGLSRLLGEGVETFEVTAIDRDGTMAGPDTRLLAQAVALAPEASVIASGGIRSLEDLQTVRRLGCSGAIVGRAIYEGDLDLAAALRWG
jgi:phosphoribosylformimino-5-aminoimidazole carboxamide ribotide isomerase